MTKEQIIRSISEEFKISELESIQFYENVFQYIEGSFRKSKNLNISDFGKFNVIEKTGTDGARVNSVKFSPSKKLATEVNYNYNNLAKILFRDIERNINKERILSLGEENLYKEQTNTEANEVFDKYSEEEKDFIEEQVNLTAFNKNNDSNDLEARVRKIEAFIAVIRRFFEEEKLGEVLPKSKTEIVPPQVDYVKRAEEEKQKDDEYKASISALENKIKELENKFKEAEAKKSEIKHIHVEEPKAKEEKFELPPIDVVPPIQVKDEKIEVKEPEKQPEPVAEKIEPVEIKEPEAYEEPAAKIIEPVEEKVQDEKIEEPKAEEPVIEEAKQPEPENKISTLGNLVVESEYVEEVKTPENFVKPEIIKTEDFSKQVEESLTPPDIEKKIEERLAEIVKEPIKKKSVERDPSTSNIDDLLRTLGTPIEEEDKIEEETIIEHKPEEPAEEITSEFFVKTEEKPEEEILPVIEKKPVTEVLPVIEELTVPEITDEKLPEIIEESKLPDTPLVSEITDTELHKKVDSLIEEFRSQSSKVKEEEEVKNAEEIKEPEPEIVKQVPPQDLEEAQLSTALSSIFNSILTSENIKQEEVKETPIIKEEVKSLHNEIVKNEKPAETLPPVEEKVEEKTEKGSLSISDIYSSAKSFNDIFEHKDEKKDKEHADDMKQIREMHEKNDTNGSSLIETNGHNLVETNGHNLTETNGHNLKELSDKDFAEMHGPGLTESGKPHDVRTSKIYTNGNPLKPYGNGNGRNGSSTLNQVLEDNGLQKESKASIIVIAVIIVIALGLLFFAIFNSGIMGKENPYSKNNGVVKVTDTKNEKYFYDNGKDKVFFQNEKGFTIQAGSYKDKETALAKRKELSDKKIENVRIEELEKDNSTYYRVRIGAFASLEEAKNYSEKF